MTRTFRTYRTGRLINVGYVDINGAGKLSLPKAGAIKLRDQLDRCIADTPDSPVDLIEAEAERMFLAKYRASWDRATGEEPYWIPFATHDQCCSLGAKEANEWRAKAEAALRERGLIADPQGHLKGVG